MGTDSDSDDQSLLQWLKTKRPTAEEVSQRTDAIFQQMLADSRAIRQPNFEAVQPRDLHLLFDLYDERFFAGKLRAALGECPLHFRLSKRMTKVGGTTARFTRPHSQEAVRYEITLSTTLLFGTFVDGDQPVPVTGLLCHNRLEAMQRIFEHELTHLLEMVIWIHSNCSRSRFQTIAAQQFGHRDHRHQLITPRERAHRSFGIRVGQNVQFTFEGQTRIGRVNRITKRASVLVRDPQGLPYSDGQRYLCFYVPVELLEPFPG